MACAAQQDITICRGSTFSMVLRWEAEPTVFKAITAITQTAPVQITATAHGLVNGWRCAIVSAKGMTQINAANSPPKAKDYHKATVVDANTVQFTAINAADYSAYTSGGYLQYLTPVNLTGYTARMKVKDAIGGTTAVSLTSPTGIAIDNTAKTITVTIADSVTAALTIDSGVYDLEVVSSGGVVTRILEGNVAVEGEVTT